MYAYYNTDCILHLGTCLEMEIISLVSFGGFVTRHQIDENLYCIFLQLYMLPLQLDMLPLQLYMLPYAVGLTVKLSNRLNIHQYCWTYITYM